MPRRTWRFRGRSHGEGPAYSARYCSRDRCTPDRAAGGMGRPWRGDAGVVRDCVNRLCSSRWCIGRLLGRSAGSQAAASDERREDDALIRHDWIAARG